MTAARPGRLAKSKAAAAAARIEAREEAVKQAAVRCIRRHGVRKMAIEDVAIAAGVSRRTFYRFYGSRRAILKAIVIDRMWVLAEKVKAILAECDGFESAVVNGTIETLRLASQDKIYMDIVSEDRTLQLDHRRGDSDPGLEVISLDIWTDVFDQARSQGVLKQTLPIREAIDWLMDVHRLFSLYDDMSEEDMAARLRTFVLPALIESSGP